MKAIPRTKIIGTFLVDWISDTAGSGEARVGFSRRKTSKVCMAKLKVF
jgi:hypothetical protein